LKADIWTNLQENLDETKVKETPTKAESEPEEVPKKNDPPKISFQHLVEDIEETNNQKDTSLQYYFICLLHLANENVSFSMRNEFMIPFISFESNRV
jgi:hypothetical protein